MLLNITEFIDEDFSLAIGLPAIPQLIILALIFLSSVILNGLSIVCIVGARVFTPINLLIINLAISDIVYALTIPIFAVHIVIPWWPFGRLGCQLAIGIDIVAMIVSSNKFNESFSLIDDEYFDLGRCLYDNCIEY
jgi:hypothetical protein